MTPKTLEASATTAISQAGDCLPANRPEPSGPGGELQKGPGDGCASRGTTQGDERSMSDPKDIPASDLAPLLRHLRDTGEVMTLDEAIDVVEAPHHYHVEHAQMLKAQAAELQADSLLDEYVMTRRVIA